MAETVKADPSVEKLEDAIRDMLDFATGFCSSKLTAEDRLEKIKRIGYRALDVVEDAA